MMATPSVLAICVVVKEHRAQLAGSRIVARLGERAPWLVVDLRQLPSLSRKGLADRLLLARRRTARAPFPGQGS